MKKIFGLYIAKLGQNVLGVFMKIWANDEVKSLFERVEKCKDSGEPIRAAFSNHAKEFKRKPNSVRNYYYFDLENLKTDKNRCKILEIDLAKHQTFHFKSFNDDEEKNLLLNVKNKVLSGKSVRKACFEVANGDLKLMTRLQNKYQNIKAKNLRKNNVIMFQDRRKTLSESDINSLFLGLVKLIKRVATEEKEQEFEKLESEFERLKSDNFKLEQKIKSLSTGKKEKLKELFRKKKGENVAQK